MAKDVPDWTRAVSQAQYQLGQFSAGPTQITKQSFDIDADTHAIGIIITGNGPAPSVQVNGNVTGVVYLSQAIPGGSPTEVYALVPVDSAWDTSVEVDINNPGSTALSVYVSGVRDPQVVQVVAGVSTFDATLPVQIENGNGVAVTVDSDSPIADALAVSLRQAVPPGWAVPQYGVVVTSAATTGNVQLAAGSGSLIPRLHDWWFTPPTTGAFLAQIEDTIGNVLALVNDQGVSKAVGDGKGIPGAAGAGLQLNVVAMPTGTWRIFVAYALAAV